MGVVLQVEITYSTSNDAVTGAAAVEDISSLVTALDAAGVTGITASDITATAPTVDIEIEWVVISETPIEAPLPADFATAVPNAVVTVAPVAVTYIVMPCSVGLETESCPSGQAPVASAAAVGCAGAQCDMTVDSDVCCSTQGAITTGSANSISMVGALMSVLPIHSFLL